MNKKAEQFWDMIVGFLFFVVGAFFLVKCTTPPPKVATPVPIRKQVLSYPYRDGSKELRAAEAKVNKKIDKIVQQWNSTCWPDNIRCGAVEVRR